ncbi:ATP-binding protein [Lachnospiraceae bacterium C1.1]|nr:ATP-binding protein [Lachnospiraceae bacterium C1.1]
MKTDELILYRDFDYKELFNDIAELYKKCTKRNPENSLEELTRKASSSSGELLEIAGTYGFDGNLWHCFLTLYLVSSENAFSVASEKKDAIDGSLNEVAKHDFAIFRECFGWDLDKIDSFLQINAFSFTKEYKASNSDGALFNRRIRDRICETALSLESAADNDEFLTQMRAFYRDFGVGKFGLHKAFRIEHDNEGKTIIVPITRVKHVNLDDLIGIDAQKKQLTYNTEAFLAGRKANNVLMFGDAGTGKSSSVKGILNRYYPEGLRMIEVYRHQFKDINDVIAQIKNRNYKFILYMDDLSFEDEETEYKYLKAIIEGGLEKKPDNVLIYASSNRRHLIHENFGDKLDVRKDDDLHASDTVQEKLSLSARFGVKIYFGRPGKREFNEIVKSIAERSGVKMSEAELLAEANKWELRNGGMSGRTAEQFIDYCLGDLSYGDKDICGN